jgi:CRISPR-associated protein Csx14
MRLYPVGSTKGNPMSNASPSVTINLDPQNPAQFFACCGLFELVARRSAAVLTWFVRNPRTPRQAGFVLREIDQSDLTDTLVALRTSVATAMPDFAGGEAPVRLEMNGFGTIELDWWLKPERTKKSEIKLWAGRQTTLENLVKPMLNALPTAVDVSILDYRVPMSGRFGLDPRSAWNTLDHGSSPDAQNADVYTYPVAEMLAAIGLQGFRPRQQARKGFLYSLWSNPLPLTVARAAAAGALPKAGSYEFKFEVAKRSGSYSYFTFAQPLED